jgi:hypothetical protein
MEWVTVCRRTNDPKLAWIERELITLGIASRRHGESFHAPILEIDAAAEDRFWEWFEPYDTIPDDDPRFEE